jgi:hypothetical protein
MIKLTLNESDFMDLMNKTPGEREPDSYSNKFSYIGLQLLFEQLSEYEDDTNYEFDKIAICCEWTEYKNIEAAKKEYCVWLDGAELVENTTVLIDKDSDIVVVQNF